MRVARSHLTQRGLHNEDRARFTELRRHEAVPSRHVILEKNRAHCGGHFLDVALIFHGKRNAVQRADGAGFRKSRVQRVRLFERLRIGRDHRVDIGAVAVKFLDPVQIEFHQFSRRQRARCIGRVDVGDRGVDDIEVCPGVHAGVPLGLAISWRV